MNHRINALLVFLLNTRRRKCKVSYYITSEEAQRSKGWTIAPCEWDPEFYILFFNGSYWSARKTLRELVIRAEENGIVFK